MFTMVETATALFVVAAGGGLVMALMRLGGKPLPPAWLSMLHGFLAAAGLTLLSFAVLTDVVDPLAKWALLLFLAAAAGGVVMYLGFRAKSKPLPVPLMLLHAILAVGGAALLVVSVVRA
jgi:hypothetical protein